MKYKDLELTDKELKELIIKKAPKFYEEFIEKGIFIFRGGYEQEDIRILKTKPTRISHGWVIPDGLEKTISTLFKRAGVASRRENTLITISNNIDDVKISFEDEFYAIPLGDYTYSYLKTLDADFNYTKSELNDMLKSIELIKELFLRLPVQIGVDITEVINSVINGDGSLFDDLIGEFDDIISEFRSDLEDDSNDDPFTSIEIEHFENKKEELISEFKFIKDNLTPEKIRSLYYVDENEPLKGNSVEVVFNCKTFLQIPIDKYSLEEIFDK